MVECSVSGNPGWSGDQFVNPQCFQLLFGHELGVVHEKISFFQLRHPDAASHPTCRCLAKLAEMDKRVPGSETGSFNQTQPLSVTTKQRD